MTFKFINIFKIIWSFRIKKLISVVIIFGVIFTLIQIYLFFLDDDNYYYFNDDEPNISKGKLIAFIYFFVFDTWLFIFM